MSFFAEDALRDVDGVELDPVFVSCRDHDSKEEAKALVEELWSGFAPYCADRHFVSEARHHFVSRTWEMYVASVLLRSEFSLQRPGPNEPDVAIVRGAEPTIWIECVAPGCGNGPDAVRDREHRGVWQDGTHPGIRWWDGRIPTDESLILRCNGALREKATKWKTWRTSTSANDKSPFVIAISLAAVPDSDMTEPPLPIIVKALFALGPQVAYRHVSIGDNGDVPGEGEIEDGGYVRRPRVVKASGAEVSSAPFLEPGNEQVSAVLFSTVGIWNVRSVALGTDLVLVHNPTAEVPLVRGFFPFGTEYWVGEDGTLQRAKHGAVRRYG
jgi:hypothetical protein